MCMSKKQVGAKKLIRKNKSIPLFRLENNIVEFTKDIVIK